MLRTLRIRDLAIIEDLVVEFGPGLNLLTGETGAGKSIVVDALSLAAGARADARLVRAGAARASVDAVFTLEKGSGIVDLLDRRGLEPADGEIVIRREVAPQGVGRAFVNGTPCPLSVLRELGEHLVELHGQHEHQSLLSLERHQELLDRFGANEDLLASVGRTREAVASAEAELARLEADRADRRERAEALGREVREIESIAPLPGEHDSLETERRLLKNAGHAAELLDSAIGALYDGEPSASSLAKAGARRIAQLAELDPSLGELALRVEAARLELEDAGSTLRDYREGKSFDPGRLDIVASRLAALDRLRLRFGADETAVLAALDTARSDLARLVNLDSEAAKAREALAGAEAGYVRAAGALSKARQASGVRLAAALLPQLAALALPKARLTVHFPPARGRTILGGAREVPISERGAERVELLLAANPGEPPQPLSKVASGGELSRIMLALHAVLEGAGGERVLVFDEVDAGVGGAVADAVGARLSDLARRSQVLCVTHLPQVAAYADRHYHVRKRAVRGRTHAEVLPLGGDGRVDELARMLGGREVTEASRRNAADLLKAASGRPREASR